MKEYFRWFYKYLVREGFDRDMAVNLNLLVNLIIIFTVVIILDYVLRKVIITAFRIFSSKTKTTFDDYLLASNFPKYIAHILPFILVKSLIPYVFSGFRNWETNLLKITDIYLIILVVWIFRSVIKSVREYLKGKEAFRDKPLDSFGQILIMFVWFIGILYIFSELSDQSILKFLTTLGAASAILLLIFKDTILGFVASIQVAVNDMVRIGDWITQEKYGADGDVTEINLTTVKVKNFDNTITTIPTYALISDSFKNWRGMQESAGRRIKRAINIKANSVKFLTDEELKEFSRIQMVQQYIHHRQKDIEKYNREHDYNKEVIVNGRNQTNLGLFRKYCDMYLNNHPALNKDLMIMTRHLAPTSQGIPLEIYAFSSDKRWENYERIMADIMEHLIAAIPHFKLEIFEEPSAKDISSIKLQLQSQERP